MEAQRKIKSARGYVPWRRGDFKAYDSEDLNDMREVGDRQEAAATAEARKGMDASQVCTSVACKWKLSTLLAGKACL